MQRVADNFGATAWVFNKLLGVVNAAHSVLGPKPLQVISSALNKVSGHMVPEWNPYMPKVGTGLVGAVVGRCWLLVGADLGQCWLLLG
jgi:hypothetical protein